MTLPAEGWKNKAGTGYRSCDCGSWKEHWKNCSGEDWPDQCSVEGCSEEPTDGAHLYNQYANGEWIAPFCHQHNCERSNEFTLKAETTLVSSNKQKTCVEYSGLAALSRGIGMINKNW